ncbi:MAG: MG2 domain-containing protein, partial [Bacteroidia bacterium]|nr:MG2 domain-containing protein [Bacteroidia bacterium]
EDFDDHLLSYVKDKAYSRKIQRTCFDLLYRRAFDFFSSEESGLTQPTYAFVLADDAGGRSLFAPAQSFASLSFATRDSASFRWRAARAIQALIAAHLDNPDALIYYDLLRLKFVYDNAVRVENKTEQYLAALENLRRRYESHPAVAQALYQEAAFRNTLCESYDPQKPESEKYRFERKKAMELCKTAVEKFPQTYWADNCKALQTDILRPSLSFDVEKVLLPDEDFVVSVVFRNVERVFLRVVKIPAFDITAKDDLDDLHSDKYARYRWLSPTLPDQSFVLPAPGDYLNHRVELPVPALPKGRYVLMVSTSPAFEYEGHAVCIAQIWVSRLSWHTDDAPSPTPRLRIADRKTGAPIPGVRTTMLVKTWQDDDYKIEESATQISNAEGIVEFKRDLRRNRYDAETFFRLQSDDDALFLTEDSFYGYYYPPSPPPPRLNHFFFTDRSIYRPGQTIYFKAIGVYWDGKQYVLDGPGKTYTVYLRDRNGVEVGRITAQTGEFGSFHGTFTAPPTGTITGTFSLQSDHGTTYVSVEEYKRPKFEVSFEPTTGSFALGQEVRIEGKAVFYAGAAVDGAEATYRVVRKARYPYWKWWWIPIPETPEVEILNGQTPTDAQGKFSFAFRALPDESVAPESLPEFDFEIHVEVVDATGETRTARTHVSVGYVALRVNIQMPERIEATQPPPMKATFENLAGQKQHASGALHVRRVADPERPVRNRYFPAPDLFLLSRDEFVRRFPHLPYAEEHLLQNRPLEGILHTQKFSASECVFDFSEKLKTWKPGDYVLTLETTDAFGKAVRVEKRFSIRSANVPFAPRSPLELEWIKTSGEPGQKAVLSVGAGQKAHFFYVVERDGNVVEARRFSLERETKIVEIPIREEWRGNFVVRYTALGENRILRGEQIVVVPWTNKKLDLKFSVFRDKLSPGTQETLTLTVKGPNGEAAAAEVLVSMYDASLDAFKAHAWPDLPLRFNLTSSFNGDAAGFGYRGAEIFARNWAGDFGNFFFPEIEVLSDFETSQLFHQFHIAYTATRMKRSIMPLAAKARNGETDERDDEEAAAATEDSEG